MTKKIKKSIEERVEEILNTELSIDSNLGGSLYVDGINEAKQELITLIKERDQVVWDAACARSWRTIYEWGRDRGRNALNVYDVPKPPFKIDE